MSQYSQNKIIRRRTKKIKVGSVEVGGDAKISVQSMTNTLTSDADATLNQINDLAKQMNVTMAQLSIAWCLKNKNVSSVILGASKKSQLKENLESLNVYNLLTEEICNILDK